MMKTFIVQSIISCACFHFIIVYSVKKSPMSWFYDYPIAVQERMRSLSEYEGKIPTKSFNLKKKFISAFVSIMILFCLAWSAGTRNFLSSMCYSFLIWTTINFYDALVLDTIWFCHNKKVRFSGTEDLASVYENPKKHWVDFAIGSIIGMIVSIGVGGVSALINLIHYNG